jgi:hypothetical protein
MSAPLLVVVALIYAYVGWEQYAAGKFGMAMVWVAYAFANLGFLLDLLWRK